MDYLPPPGDECCRTAGPLSSFTVQLIMMRGMSQLIPGHATFVRVPDPAGIPRVTVILCDNFDPSTVGRCLFKLRGKAFIVEIQSVTVAAVVVIIRLTIDNDERFYTGWVDEQSPGGSEVLEALASQGQLTVWLAPPDGKGAASTVIPNVLRDFARRNLAKVLSLAEAAPWDMHSFAAARTLLESQNSPVEVFWERLKEEV
jgi:hypothetical protein